jgi:hypothetical protein
MRIAVCAGALAVLLLGPPAALAHQGNPHYRSTITRVTPAVKGMSVSVLNYDDRLQLQNTTGSTVVVYDYKGAPYARLLPDRTVEVNTNSEAYYLNNDRYGQVTVPKGLGPQPRWKLVDRTGRFEWHDHRIHWMSKSDPPQLKDKNVRTHIFDWRVPIQVGTRRGAIAGSLSWVPLPGGSVPTGAIVALVALVILAAAGGLLVHRRRVAAAGGEELPRASAEVW